MNRLRAAFATLAALFASASPAFAAKPAGPAPVAYPDALRCATFDGFMAVMLAGEHEEHLKEPATVYYSTAGDLWLTQASKANPGGEKATNKDFQTATDVLVKAFAAAAKTDGDKAFKAIYAQYAPACDALEQVAWGGPEGLSAKSSAANGEN
ncbi:hypothetical protein [Novosphingobium lentum]|uniref:hypothetical protein n=1 Tax=Novosphingobium lentum TaxID=145287 RepID=UPI000830FFBC|nr:hypothetical protein [Novosphingobium lentum]